MSLDLYDRMIDLAEAAEGVSQICVCLAGARDDEYDRSALVVLARSLDDAACDLRDELGRCERERPQVTTPRHAQ